MTYIALKYLHVGCVIVSGAGFFGRGLCRLFVPHWLKARWLRVVPHVVDTLLLTSAGALAVISHQYPLAQAWLTAKVFALLVYIVCGALALRPGPRPTAWRAFFFVAALLTYGYIVSVALTRSPFGPLVFGV